ncbi:hypothetical protein [Sphingomonas sp.]|uniref:hypothetical protein n=1 Tax=Sphingomonas sp. TaxID=28214 RepID=UPI002DD6B0C6|nr:hypothetical protein [Sphingomonas sp.]
MTLGVEVYGFGSAFAHGADPNDIDLLIVHPDTDPASCKLAIACKRGLVEHLSRAHVTMLSASEAAHFQFIRTARAFCLQAVRNRQMEQDLAAILLEIHRRQPKSFAVTGP